MNATCKDERIITKQWNVNINHFVANNTEENDKMSTAEIIVLFCKTISHNYKDIEANYLIFSNYRYRRIISLIYVNTFEGNCASTTICITTQNINRI